MNNVILPSLYDLKKMQIVARERDLATYFEHAVTNRNVNAWSRTPDFDSDFACWLGSVYQAANRTLAAGVVTRPR